ncbi:MAG: hypothetical protein ACYCX2_10505 [Christensenellales bacterium]
MGIMIGFGDSFMEALISQKASCLKCKKTITFEEGSNYAREQGINDKVVMCSKCNSVFEVYLAPGRMVLTKDVTNKYKKIIKKESFFGKIFRK